MVMKKTSKLMRIFSLLMLTFLFTSFAAQAQDSREERLMDDAENAKSELTESNKLMQHMFDNAYGYAILPNVGKGAAGIGAAAGSGIVYEQGKVIGSVKMKQLTVGLQVGGEAYREVIFFEDKETLERFKTNELEFAAQTSAAAINSENYKDASYKDGVLVFTQKKTGLMYDASIGGQKFNYNSF
jgi:lipid-binding SYLF domain-containing protein